MEDRAKRLSLLAIGGILTGLTLVFTQLGFLEWLTLVPAALVLLSIAEKTRLRGLWGYGFFFFLCYYLVIYHWFLMLYPLDFIDSITTGAAIFVVCAGWIGLSLLQAIGGGFVFLLFGIFCRGSFAKKYPLSKPFFIAALWAVFEWTQTIGWAGVPWGRLALGQSEYVIELQSASLFGSYFISFLLVAVNFLVAYALHSKEKVKLCAVLCSSIIVANTVFGAALYFGNTPNGDQKIRIAAVQGNVSTKEKWEFENLSKIFEIYRKCTMEAAEDGADIVLWPETALPIIVDEGSIEENYLKSVAREADVIILAGAFTEGEGGEQYNSILTVYPDGTIDDTVYSKRHLVPFGEYLPMAKLVEIFMPPLAELMKTDELTAGEGANIISLERADIGALICFDSIYEELALDSVRSGAGILTVSTNDSWFSDSAALYMHNAQAKLRAIENNRYVVRAANTGISALISDRGEILEMIEPLRSGYIIGEAEANTERTLYSYIGNTFVYICAFVIVLSWFCEIYFHKFEKSIDKI